MKLSVSRETLHKCLKHMVAVVEKRTSIAILSNVRLKASGNQLELTATDNDITVQGVIEAFVEEEGTTTAHANKLFEIITKIPEGVMVNLTQVEDGNRLTVDAGKAHFSLACLSADAFPDMTRLDDGVSFELDSVQIQRLLGKSSFAASADDTRAYLNGVYLHVTEDDTPLLRAVATDGHRLAKVDMDLPEGAANMSAVILPRKCVNELRKLTEDAKSVRLTVGEKKIQAEAGDLTLTSKLIDGTFPDYNRVIPQADGVKMEVTRRTLLQAVERVAILSHEKSRSIKFSLKPQHLAITANNPDQENASEEVKVDYDAQELDVGFNAKYLAEIGQHMEGDDMTFAFQDNTSPVMVTDKTDASALYVVMPMRV